VRIGLAGADGQDGVQHQDTAFGPGHQTAVRRDRAADVGVQLLEDVDQRWRLADARSEEHTSELQSPCNLVCRLLLEKKKSEGMVLSAVYDIRKPVGSEEFESEQQLFMIRYLADSGTAPRLDANRLERE